MSMGGRLRRAASVTTILASILVVAPTVAAEAAWCPKGIEREPGVGRACRMPNGLLQLETDRGTGRYTHGADLFHPAADGLEIAEATPSDPACVTDGSYRILVTYAHPSGAGDYATRAPQIRSLVRSANGRLDEETGEFGASAAYEVECTPGGAITVVDAALPTGTTTDFSSVVGALTSRGGAYDDPKVKHWVWYEGRTSSSGVSGTGHIYDDDDLELENRNNGNANSISTYAVQWGHCCGNSASSGFFGVGTWMHELGHNLGAVQGGGTGIDAAPHSTSYGHCNDGQDIMCYADGSPNSNYNSSVCTDRAHFDCNHDDYFNPSPAAGSYLKTHWNLASCFNRYLWLSYCGAPAPPTLRLAASTLTVGEGDGSARIVLERGGSTANAVSATITSSDDTASAGIDYTATSTVATVPAGATSVTAQIPVVQDTLDEPNERFTVTLSAPSGATLSNPTAMTVTITDDDEAPAPPPSPDPSPNPVAATISFLMDGMRVNENAGTLSIPVARTGALTDPLGIGVQRSGDASTADASSGGAFTVIAGATQAILPLTITDDATPETDETIVLTLQPTDGTTTLGSIPTMTITIDASDVQPDATIAIPGGTVRGAGIVNGTARNQTIGANARRWEWVTRVIRIGHDGPAAADLLLRRSATPAGTAVRVLLNGVEVTAPLASSIRVPLEPGEQTTLTISMRFVRSLSDGTLRGVTVTARRSSDGLRLDAVRAQLRYVR